VDAEVMVEMSAGRMLDDDELGFRGDERFVLSLSCGTFMVGRRVC